MKVIFGIDPGIKGGISAYANGKIILSTQMPLTDEGEIDVRRVFNIVLKIRRNICMNANGEHVECFSYIEKVGAMPGQGVVSMFTFGNGFGAIKAVFELHMNVILVTPQSWKKVVLEGYEWKQSVPKLILPANATKEEINALKKEHNRMKSEAKRNGKFVSIRYIKDNFPEVDLIQKGKVEKDGIADACCIAVYGAIKENIFKKHIDNV